MKDIIIADIGGTKSVLAYYRLQNYRYEHIEQKIYASNDYETFDDLLWHFIHLCHLHKVELLSVSIAGPVINGRCKTTNLPWMVYEKDLSRRFNIEQVVLTNDIEATAIGLLHANYTDMIQVNPTALLTQSHRAVISIGTGLGEAYMFWDGQQYHPSSSEGGHTDLAPQHAADIDLWEFLHQRYPNHLSYERLLSGPGIALIYEYACLQHGCRDSLPEENQSAWVSEKAMHGGDVICQETMEVFIRFLAAEAANLSLKLLALGGIYITGGITAKIAPLLSHSHFIDAFVDKGRLKSILETIPVWVCLNDSSPLQGALWKAKNTIANANKPSLKRRR